MAPLRSAFRLCAGLGSGLILLVAGCATAPAPAASNPPTPATSAALPPPFSQLQKGMSLADVRARVGAPTDTKPFITNGVNAQIWSYPLGSTDHTTVVAVATRASSGVNPISGLPSQIPDQVYQNQTVTVIETLELLVIGEQLVEWKVTRKTRGSFQ